MGFVLVDLVILTMLSSCQIITVAASPISCIWLTNSKYIKDW